MRVAFISVTLSVLIGCDQFVPYPDDSQWGVTSANSREVVITSGVWGLSGTNRGSLNRKLYLERAQQECGYYGKDAVMVREEPAYSYTRYHYRCEPRKAE